ncbi:MAG: bifunctional phosphoribosyl-AMP cyclohydrolase/phosphoribosyl-ATP diphosphatase HisIE [Lachnospiraceae bacterium]|nr:bifunctional phosphoribosyl-AMP cyclohydrolase/phosphoribosyl-ATP diphosphatase HisIE [Lachnospiraceae bacterium]
MLRKLISPIYLREGRAVRSLTDHDTFGDGDAVRLARDYSNRGADIMLIFDQSESDEQHDVSLTLMREMARVSDIPMWGAGNVKRVEDVKKILYAGCRRAVLNCSKPSNMQMLEEVSKRFGRDKIAVCAQASACETIPADVMSDIITYSCGLIVLADSKEEMINAASRVSQSVDMGGDMRFEIDVMTSSCARPPESGDEAASWPGFSSDRDMELLSESCIAGVGGSFTMGEDPDLMGIKAKLRESGMEVNLFESSFSWDELKKQDGGLIPVVVQDYRNEEVLMVAYMNREAYEQTIRTGIMTYWSRSRSELWVKGMTSGHFQYLKELRVDCDNDTLLARVSQIGAACHTGNRSCFYRSALKKDMPHRNPMKVFEDVYSTIEDRKAHPKEGSYTNYLFEKGIDKILKKCGEEAAEIIIAAKNPNPEEIKYEIADFLYHMMVLMSQRGITWDDIATELANRE